MAGVEAVPTDEVGSGVQQRGKWPSPPASITSSLGESDYVAAGEGSRRYRRWLSSWSFNRDDPRSCRGATNMKVVYCEIGRGYFGVRQNNDSRNRTSPNIQIAFVYFAYLMF